MAINIIYVLKLVNIGSTFKNEVGTLGCDQQRYGQFGSEVFKIHNGKQQTISGWVIVEFTKSSTPGCVQSLQKTPDGKLGDEVVWGGGVVVDVGQAVVEAIK